MDDVVPHFSLSRKQSTISGWSINIKSRSFLLIAPVCVCVCTRMCTWENAIFGMVCREILFNARSTVNVRIKKHFHFPSRFAGFKSRPKTDVTPPTDRSERCTSLFTHIHMAAVCVYVHANTSSSLLVSQTGAAASSFTSRGENAAESERKSQNNS